MSFHFSSIPLKETSSQERALAPQAGAFVSFEGRVRNHHHGRRVEALEYEAYSDLATEEAAKILTEAKTKFDIVDVQCVHRTGKLTVGETAVWISVNAAHRDAAFRACRYVIDELKTRVPIWKKEYYVDGQSDWVKCESCETISEDKFYSRQTNLPGIGAQGQNKLKNARVLVVGAGGLGCPALFSLASAGVGTIGICEHDVLETSNLHRQSLYSHKDVGQPKAELAQQRIQALNPFVKVEVMNQKLAPANVEQILKPYDLILDCTDNLKTKLLLSDAAVLLKKTLVTSSVYQFEGQLQVYRPGQTACLRCTWSKAPRPDCVGTCAESGVVGPTPSILGHMQALEVIKIILGIPPLADEIIFFNLLTYELRKIKQRPNPDCPSCSQTPSLTNLKEDENMTEPQTLDPSSVSKEELKKFQFIDIREQVEVTQDPVEGFDCIHLPLSQYQHGQFTFEKDKRYLILCTKGVRSLGFVEYLHGEGVTNVVSLDGGLDALKTHE